jgi:hypothetical protein
MVFDIDRAAFGVAAQFAEVADEMGGGYGDGLGADWIMTHGVSPPPPWLILPVNPENTLCPKRSD